MSRGRCRPDIEPRKYPCLGRRRRPLRRKATPGPSPARDGLGPHGVEDPEHARNHLAREPGDPSLAEVEGSATPDQHEDVPSVGLTCVHCDIVAVHDRLRAALAPYANSIGQNADELLDVDAPLPFIITPQGRTATASFVAKAGWRWKTEPTRSHLALIPGGLHSLSQHARQQAPTFHLPTEPAPRAPFPSDAIESDWYLQSIIALVERSACHT